MLESAFKQQGQHELSELLRKVTLGTRIYQIDFTIIILVIMQANGKEECWKFLSAYM